MSDITTIQTIERNTSVLLQKAAQTAEAIASAAETDDRYDELSALTAAIHIASADGLLPLPETVPDAWPPDIATPAVDSLALRLDAAADQLADLGREATVPRTVHDRYKAAVCVRKVAIALRNAAAPDGRQPS
ncbi:hypothetical protein ACGFX4_20090 [Kitasatospora sp. NPDC048365]|uniref:hypothetical protein n=1 Tax=Kitasatospora sp. NPDC048365 TaxID=3364050 RepID=UPI003711B8E3